MMSNELFTKQKNKKSTKLRINVSYNELQQIQKTCVFLNHRKYKSSISRFEHFECHFKKADELSRSREFPNSITINIKSSERYPKDFRKTLKNI